jgi:Zn ribbon nucleic-acid-binding protein
MTGRPQVEAKISLPNVGKYFLTLRSNTRHNRIIRKAQKATRTVNTWTEANLDSRICVQCGLRYAPRQSNQICCGSRKCIQSHWNDKRREGAKLLREKLHDEAGNYIGPTFNRRFGS